MFREGQPAVSVPIAIITGVGELSLVFMIGHCGAYGFRVPGLRIERSGQEFSNLEFELG